MKNICAFSSDARELYKADIFRVLSLPENSIIHFRYSKKYVDGNFLHNINSIINKNCYILFTTNNDLSKNENIGSIRNIPIRKAIINNALCHKDTDLIHIFLKLKNFINVTIDSNNPTEKLPPNKFLSELECTELQVSNNWLARINEVKTFFPSLQFYQLTGISDESGNYQKISETDCKKISYYKLKTQRRYYLNMSFSNENKCNSNLLIKEKSNLISINSNGKICFQGRYDNENIAFATNSISTPEVTIFLSFNQEKDSKIIDGYNFQIEIRLQQWLRKIFIFGFLSSIVVITLKLISLDNEVYLNSLLIICLTFSSGILYYLFNKK